MKRLLKLSTLLACAIPISSFAAERILVDFGRDNETATGPDLFGRYWNNFTMTSGQSNLTPVLSSGSVLNRDGTVATGVALEITDGFYKSSTNSAGGEEIYTTNATTDFFYLQSGNTLGKVKISGLDASGSTVYDFKFLVSSNRSLPEVFLTDFSAVGSTTSATVSLEAIGNQNTVASIDGMIPNGSGEIEITVAKNATSTNFGAISLFEMIGRAPADPVSPDPEPYEGAVPPGAWTIALIPDTQYYSEKYPGVFSAQTAWLRDHQRDYNIRFALHVGDITNNNTDEEWERARNSMALLDGRLPYFFVPGNHDYGPNGNSSTRDTLMNQYFEFDDFSKRLHFGGARDSGKMDNSYHTISAGGYDWIILCLEWGPTDATVTWADGVLSAHPNHKAILVTHAFMYYDDTRYDHTGPDQSWNPHGDYSTPGNPKDGQELWDELVKKHDFVLTVNGHVLGDGTGFRSDPNLAGQNVHQMLANYQHPITTELDGNGYLRLLTVTPDGTVHVKTYSPIYHDWDNDADQEFTFDFEWYSPVDSNANTVPDYYDESLDSDSDGLSNYEEFMTYGTDPNLTDSDGDGIADGLEVQIGTDPAVSSKQVNDSILAHASQFRLYSEQDIVDLNLGSLMLSATGNDEFRLELQLETTDDLANTPFAPVDDPFVWTLSVPESKHFMRVRALP